MLSDAEKLRRVEMLINNVEWPDDGTYEDMYNFVSGELQTLIRRLRRVVVQGEALDSIMTAINNKNGG